MLKKSKFWTAKTAIVLFTIVFFVQTIIFNFLYPIYADDWVYTFVWGFSNIDDAVRVNGISDILRSQYAHYFGWGGRVVAHALAQFFLMLPPVVFDIVNSILFILFLGIIYKIARNKHNHNVFLFLIIMIGMWFFQPAFASITFWLTGSCNYLWCTFIVILFLYPYIQLYRGDLKPRETKQYIFSVSIFFFGIIAGWTNENTSVAMIFFLVCLLIICKIEKNKIPFWAYTGLIGAVIGCTLLLIAPGNTARAIAESANVKETGLDFSTIISMRLDLLYYSYIKFTLAPTILFLGVFIFRILFNRGEVEKREFTLPILLLLAAHVAFVAMVATPIFPARAAFGLNTFIIIGIAMMYANIDLRFKIFKIANVLGVILAFGYYIYSYSVVYERLVIMDKLWTSREKKIEESKAKGVLDIEFDDVLIAHKKLDVFDLDRDSTSWQNIYYSKFHGINSVKRKSTDDYKLGIYPQE